MSQPALSNLERVLWGQQAHEDIGIHSLWGLSPMRDLLSALPQSVGDTDDPINVLLMSPGDIRHVLCTLSNRRFGEGAKSKMRRPVHFYVHESNAELLARHLLLLRVAIDWELPFRQRTAAWLEIFGNGLVQERTARYVERLGEELVELATNAHVDSMTADVVDLSRLKFKERDLLAEAARSWRSADFPFTQLWDSRLRKSLGSRYDNRDGVFDWDYRYGIQRLGGGIVHVKQYKHWRDTGIAFEFGDQQYIMPNRSLATYAEGLLRSGRDKGLRRELRGYWGDSVVGPYIALGIEADHDELARSLFEVVDKGTGTERFRHNATEVAVYNILSCLWTLETGVRYAMSERHNIYSGLSADDTHTTNDQGRRSAQALDRANHIMESLEGIRIVPLCGDLASALRKANLEGSLDVAFVGLHAVQLVESCNLRNMLKKGAVIIAESAKFLVPLKTEKVGCFVLSFSHCACDTQRQLFARKVHAMACAMNFVPTYATKPAPEDDANVTAVLGPCSTMPVDVDSAIYIYSRSAD